MVCEIESVLVGEELRTKEELQNDRRHANYDYPENSLVGVEPDKLLLLLVYNPLGRRCPRLVVPRHMWAQQLGYMYPAQLESGLDGSCIHQDPKSYSPHGRKLVPGAPPQFVAQAVPLPGSAFATPGRPSIVSAAFLCRKCPNPSEAMCRYWTWAAHRRKTSRRTRFGRKPRRTSSIHPIKQLAKDGCSMAMSYSEDVVRQEIPRKNSLRAGICPDEVGQMFSLALPGLD